MFNIVFILVFTVAKIMGRNLFMNSLLGNLFMIKKVFEGKMMKITTTAKKFTSDGGVSKLSSAKLTSQKTKKVEAPSAFDLIMNPRYSSTVQHDEGDCDHDLTFVSAVEERDYYILKDNLDNRNSISAANIRSILVSIFQRRARFDAIFTLRMFLFQFILKYCPCCARKSKIANSPDFKRQ